jgi:hypothetical protein
LESKGRGQEKKFELSYTLCFPHRRAEAEGEKIVMRAKAAAVMVAVAKAAMAKALAIITLLLLRVGSRQTKIRYVLCCCSYCAGASLFLFENLDLPT